jgi:hypothetical protein
MPEIKLKMAGWLTFVFSAIWIFGCSDAGPDAVTDFLIKVEDRKVSVYEFNQAFAVAKLAYSHTIIEDPQLALEAKTQLLKEMIEEQLILERAEELQIQISEEELVDAVSQIKADYPEDSFEQILLENAVSFSFWKERLKKRLLKQKVIAKEIMENINISPSEIEDYYIHYTDDQKTKPESEKDTKILTYKIISHIRREKAKTIYPKWIHSLWEKYDVKINQLALE